MRGWMHEIRVGADEAGALNTLDLAPALRRAVGAAGRGGDLRLDTFDLNALEAAAQDRLQGLAGENDGERHLRGHLAAVLARMPRTADRGIRWRGVLLRALRRGIG